MIKKLPILLFLSQLSVFAQEPIFTPSAIITPFGNVSSPPNESYTNVIDEEISTKFLDFNYIDGIGFTVNLEGVQKTATSIAITTANDVSGRDPMNYQIWGSNNGTDYTTITTGSIACDATRFNTRTYTFTNTQAYSFYQLVFTNQCDANEGMFQIAEVQLFQNPLSSQDFTKAMFEVYPNPNNGIFSITAQNDVAIDFIIINDVCGKQIKRIDCTRTTSSDLNLQGFSSGIYFAKITSEKGTAIKKIVIK
jgi:hypothetical protein